MDKESKVAVKPKLLDRNAIFQTVDLKIETVNVPEWGGAVKVRGMTGAERDLFESHLITQDAKGRTKTNMRNARARIVVICCVDDDGKQIFQEGDIADLSRKSASALDRIYEVAATLSGIGDADLDDLLGNSGSDQSADSGSV